MNLQAKVNNFINRSTKQQDKQEHESDEDTSKQDWKAGLSQPQIEVVNRVAERTRIDENVVLNILRKNDFSEELACSQIEVIINNQKSGNQNDNGWVKRHTKNDDGEYTKEEYPSKGQYNKPGTYKQRNDQTWQDKRDDRKGPRDREEPYSKFRQPDYYQKSNQYRGDKPQQKNQYYKNDQEPYYKNQYYKNDQDRFQNKYKNERVQDYRKYDDEKDSPYQPRQAKEQRPQEESTVTQQPKYVLRQGDEEDKRNYTGQQVESNKKPNQQSEKKEEDKQRIQTKQETQKNEVNNKSGTVEQFDKIHQSPKNDRLEKQLQSQANKPQEKIQDQPKEQSAENLQGKVQQQTSTQVQAQNKQSSQPSPQQQQRTQNQQPNQPNQAILHHPTPQVQPAAITTQQPINKQQPHVGQPQNLNQAQQQAQHYPQQNYPQQSIQNPPQYQLQQQPAALPFQYQHSAHQQATPYGFSQQYVQPQPLHQQRLINQQQQPVNHQGPKIGGSDPASQAPPQVQNGQQQIPLMVYYFHYPNNQISTPYLVQITPETIIQLAAHLNQTFFQHQQPQHVQPGFPGVAYNQAPQQPQQQPNK